MIVIKNMAQVKYPIRKAPQLECLILAVMLLIDLKELQQEHQCKKHYSNKQADKMDIRSEAENRNLHF